MRACEVVRRAPRARNGDLRGGNQRDRLLRHKDDWVSGLMFRPRPRPPTPAAFSRPHYHSSQDRSSQRANRSEADAHEADNAFHRSTALYSRLSASGELGQRNHATLCRPPMPTQKQAGRAGRPKAPEERCLLQAAVLPVRTLPLAVGSGLGWTRTRFQYPRPGGRSIGSSLPAIAACPLAFRLTTHDVSATRDEKVPFPVRRVRRMRSARHLASACARALVALAALRNSSGRINYRTGIAGKPQTQPLVTPAATAG